ncbi:MAG TPA: hypothetical protein VF207_01150 [Chthoniobacterales bacterium]
MRPEKTPITEALIREIRELARLSDELTANAHAIRAELAQLQEQLGIQRPLGAPSGYGRNNRPN